ncbi:lethal(2) giant larvae protein homolog 1 isoform X2 [Centruroides vittatus]|uniref:lethal(2) giant larvae protein homolog 1 isoform X2 n=1 Tax=Centruroides vittatus TaxID=120091 RepID=UPI00350FA08B
MLKFIRGKGHHISAERQKLQKELFTYRKTIAHGFPHRPSALSWDPKLHLMAVGTRTGSVRIYGTPGVEFYGEHQNECCVIQLFFLPNQGSLISLCDDNSLHLWELNLKDGKWIMEEVKSCSLEGRFKKISSCCLQSSGEHLLIGTEGGNIYLLDVKSFEMTDHIIYQDVVMQNVPDDYKINPGAVEAIAEHPTNADKILIGYNRGLMVLWDNKALNAENTYVGSQQLESIAWHHDGTQFMSAHNDGSYIIWNKSDSTKPSQAPHTPYGPFPCKAINKIVWKTAKAEDDFIIFSGGMPRATFGERNTVTVMHGDRHQVLDFTSKVIDFFTISNMGENSEFDNPHSLIVLAEEELIAVDLESEDWLPFRLPYLSSLHSSAITCCQHCTNIGQDVWNKIVTAGNKQVSGKYTERIWPIDGGKDLIEKSSTFDILLTGHEDGSVRFWDASGISLYHLYTLQTSYLFVSEEHEQNASEEMEEWPPFRKIGTFDPYSDDPRLAIKKINLCTLSGILVIAGTAGQVIILELQSEEVEKEITYAPANIVGDRDNFVWKGHSQLNRKTGAQKLENGYQPKVILQLSPPAAVTALALHSDWSLVAAGTAHGFTLYDYIQDKVVMSKCTLNPNDLSATGDAAMSRRKSFKKSLRESFRRLRKRRSQRSKGDKTPTRPSNEEGKQSPQQSPVTDLDAPSGDSHSPTQAAIATDSRPVERQVEARSVDDALSSMVRCLYFAKSFIINNVVTTPTLWAGTNSGAIYVFTMSLPNNEKRSSDAVTCQLGKEIQLKHRAPVIAIQIVDHNGYPLPEPLEIENQRAKAPDYTGNHRVLICSEEQFKVFTLPSLKPFCKFKLTAHEGARVRRVGIANFRSKSDENYCEYCLTCLTNQGSLSIYSIPELRRQLAQLCLKREDINGISSLVFSKTGEGFYLHSPCEFERFSLSASNITQVLCSIELPEGCRPIIETKEEVKEEPKEEQENKVDEPNAEVIVNETAEVTEIAETTDDVPAADSTGDKTQTSNDAAEEEHQPVKQDGNISQDEERRDLDITVDSIRDHIGTTNSDESTTVLETREESKVVRTQETVRKVTSTTVTRETIVNSTEEN